MTMRVAVVGTGLIGSRRAQVARQYEGTEPVVIVSKSFERAARLAAEVGAQAATDWQTVVARNDVDIVVVSTTNY